MVDNQHKLITGYRDLSKDEIVHMNAVKAMAVEVGTAIEEVDKLEGVDQRWLAIAKIDLQKGFMALVRAIARPSTF